MVMTQRTPGAPIHGYRIDAAKALAVAMLCWCGLAATVWAVHSGHAAPLDQTGLLVWRGSDLHPPDSPRMLETIRDLTALGGVLLRNLFAVIAVVALCYVRLRREAILLAFTVMLGWGVNSAIKALVGRARPDIVPHLMEAGGNSFPSGHSFNAAVVYISIALAFAALTSRESARIAIIVSALIMSMAVAWSRVWLGVHWPSDVIAGWLGGAGWAFMASAVLFRPAKAAAEASATAR